MTNTGYVTDWSGLNVYLLYIGLACSIGSSVLQSSSIFPVREGWLCSNSKPNNLLVPCNFNTDTCMILNV